MLHDYVTEQGNETNEDYVYACDKFGYVLDGASGLYQEQVTNEASDAKWFSHALGEKLKQYLFDETISIAEVLQKCCEEAMKEYVMFLEERQESLDKERLPSCTVSIVRFKNQQVEIFQLGDSPIIVETKKGMDVYEDPVISSNDQQAINLLKGTSERKGTSVREEKETVAEMLREHRSQKNQPGGYWIADPLGEGIVHGRKATYSIEDVVKIIVMSDGVWEAYQVFNQYANLEAFVQTLVAPNGFQMVIKTLRKAQTNDPSYSNYPRLKLMDDASVLYYNI